MEMTSKMHGSSARRAAAKAGMMDQELPMPQGPEAPIEPKADPEEEKRKEEERRRRREEWLRKLIAEAEKDEQSEKDDLEFGF